MYAGHFLVLDDGTGTLRGYVLAGTSALDRDSWIWACAWPRTGGGTGWAGS
ncbi:hypothetical protein SFUMM280S_07537 [Streptomyces fumanus]